MLYPNTTIILIYSATYWIHYQEKIPYNNSNNNVRLSGNYQPSSLNQYNNNPNISNNQNIRVSSLNKPNISGPGLFANQGRNAEEDYLMGRNSQDLMKIDKKYWY